MTVSYRQNYSDIVVPCGTISPMDYKGFSSDDERAWKLTPDSPWPRVIRYALVTGVLCGLAMILYRLTK